MLGWVLGLLVWAGVLLAGSSARLGAVLFLLCALLGPAVAWRGGEPERAWRLASVPLVLVVALLLGTA